MPSVSYGNTLTDLGRNIAEQKASERALAGILAQVGAQKLAALNALAANRGRTQADRDVGMDRNATQRQVAVMESMLRAQELGDRDRQSRDGLAAAEAIARLQGANNLAVAGMPFGAEAQNLAKIVGGYRQLDPRLAGDVLGLNAQAETNERDAEAIAAQANIKADLEFDKLGRAKRNVLKTTLNPFYGDADYERDYMTAVAGIPMSFGAEFGRLIEPVHERDGRIRFRAKRFQRIAIPQMGVPTTDTGTTNAVPVVPAAVPVPQARAVPNMGIPLMSRPMAPIAPPSFAVPMTPSNLPASTVIDADGSADLRQRVLAFAQSLRDAGIPDSDIAGRVYNAFPAARGMF